MSEINFTDMNKMQLDLHKAHPSWGMPRPEIAKDTTLYMVEEIGEMVAILKKKGEDAILNNEIVRENFTTEMVDVLMYLNKLMLCFEITPQEISDAFVKKHNYNLEREWQKQNDALYSQKPI
ncbi:MAG: nucleotide pyrophosphohydrolase [Clostridia bacterium]